MLTILRAISSVFRFIASCIWNFFKVFYKLLKLLRIRVLFLYLLTSGILYLWRPFTENELFHFFGGILICCFITVLAWIFSVRRNNKKREKKKQLKDTSEQDDTIVEDKQTSLDEQPVYYNVEGRPGYVYAEFEDRYELYFQENGKLILKDVQKKENSHD